MKTVILCGGQGTRMREETEFKPKPMVTIGGRPILWHVMKMYGQHGLTDFVLALGYKGEMIKDYFLHYEAMNNDFTMTLGHNDKVEYHNVHGEKNFQVTLANTGENTMTGARIKKIEKYIDEDTFCLTYGDGVSDVDISKLVAFHKKHGKTATVCTVHAQSRYGSLGLSGDQVTSFAEKPLSEGWISVGFFVLDKKVFTYVTDDDTCTFEQKPLQQLAKDGELMAYRHEGFFAAMDTYREAQALNDLWNKKAAPWKTW
ncbi:MAG: glucose-1-phosphate cytidylyltransferase [Candidatus Peribacteraceae bacterium]